MPRRKPKPEKQIQQKIKETLDSIIDDEDLELESVSSADLPKLKSTEILDFTVEKSNVSSDARNLLDKMVDFYLDANLIGEDDHIDYKKKMDAMNLSSMLLQLKTAQHTIIKIMEEIDLGRMEPRLIEVLAQLQSQIMQMPKDYQNYLEKMEDSYKRMRDDYEKKKLRGGVIVDESGEAKEIPSGEGLKVRGNKGLMETMRDMLGSEIEDVTLDSDDLNENSIVNAKTKAEKDAEKKAESGDEEEDDGIQDVDDELFNT